MKLVEFYRINPNRPIEERVWVVVDKKLHPNDNERFIREAYNQLFKQYPIWKCPYGKVKTPSQIARHSWSSAFMGNIIDLTTTTT